MLACGGCLERKSRISKVSFGSRLMYSSNSVGGTVKSCRIPES